MPLFSLVADDPTLAPMLGEVNRREQGVAERIASGDHAGAAEEFVAMALGPGSWRQLPPTVQSTMIENAPTYLDEVNDPEQTYFDLDWIRGFSKPALLTTGDQSPPFAAPIVPSLLELCLAWRSLRFRAPGMSRTSRIPTPMSK